MPTLLEIQLRKAERAKQALEDAKTAATKARTEALKSRKAQQATKTAVAWMIGETIRDAHDDLTPQEKATIGNILASRKDTPRDWNLLADWLPAPARPNLDKPDMAEAAE